jgi:hypothetical protein
VTAVATTTGSSAPCEASIQRYSGQAATARTRSATATQDRRGTSRSPTIAVSGIAGMTRSVSTVLIVNAVSRAISSGPDSH